MEDVKKIFEKDKKRERKTLTIYFDTNLFKEFKKLCESEGASASSTLEKLVRRFMSEFKSKK